MAVGQMCRPAIYMKIVGSSSSFIPKVSWSISIHFVATMKYPNLLAYTPIWRADIYLD